MKTKNGDGEKRIGERMKTREETRNEDKKRSDDWA
jgi:hypothetical protein